MTLLERVQANAAKKAGLSVEEVRTKSPEAIRDHLTKKTGKKFSIISEFPSVGRGNVLRDGIVSSRQIDRM